MPARRPVPLRVVRACADRGRQHGLSTEHDSSRYAVETRTVLTRRVLFVSVVRYRGIYYTPTSSTVTRSGRHDPVFTRRVSRYRGIYYTDCAPITPAAAAADDDKDDDDDGGDDDDDGDDGDDDYDDDATSSCDRYRADSTATSGDDGGDDGDDDYDDDAASDWVLEDELLWYAPLRRALLLFCCFRFRRSGFGFRVSSFGCWLSRLLTIARDRAPRWRRTQRQALRVAQHQRFPLVARSPFASGVAPS